MIGIRANHSYINIFSLGIWFFYCQYGNRQFFLSELSKLLIVAFFELVSPILVFRLLLFICLLFLLDNLFGVCKKSVMSSFEPFFIIFRGEISFSILTTAVSVGNLGWLSVLGEVALMCVQWPGQKAKKLFVISIITPCFFIQDRPRIIGWFPKFLISK